MDPNKNLSLDAEGLKQVEGVVGAALDKALEKYHGQLLETGKAQTETRTEVKTLAEHYATIAERLDKVEQLGLKVRPGQAIETRSIGQRFVVDAAVKAVLEGKAGKARVEFKDDSMLPLAYKNTILGEEGSPQEPSDTLVPSHRIPGIFGGAFRTLRILDALPSAPTASNKVEFTRELTFTNDAAETREGAAKPESDITFELADAPVRTIAHFIKLSKQVLEDAPALAAYVDRRLRYGVEKRAETQVVSGNGTSPNLAGLFTAPNFTAFTPETGETALDSLNRMKNLVIAADYAPTAFFVNPTDWGAIERLKKSDSGYIVADGAGITYVQNGLIPLVWGLPVIVSNSIPQGYGACGAWDQACQVFVRGGTVVEMFEQDSDNVQKNLITVRAEQRIALAVFRPASIYKGALTQ
jgi:HK97 family phage major capsid protein